jgi:hypothetical protein
VKEPAGGDPTGAPWFQRTATAGALGFATSGPPPTRASYDPEVNPVRIVRIVLAVCVLLAAVASVDAFTGQSLRRSQGTPRAPSLSGRVLDNATMRPVAGAAIEVGGVKTRADEDGHFDVDLPGGAARVTISADGYLTEHVDVTISATTTTIEVLLLTEMQFKEEVKVTAATLPLVMPPSTTAISPLQVQTIAGAGENVFHALQTLPGVNATADFDSRLAVRGGGPDQNLTVMDGVEIHNPYRLFGLTSAFNPETVESFELTAGGFSPKYGDRLSSILLVENRAGSRSERLGGSLTAAFTDANVILEGKLPGDIKGSWLLTGRRTYYDLLADRLTGTNLPSFGDVQAKSVWEIRPGQRITLFALRSRELTDASFDFDSGASTIGLKDAARNDLVSLSFFSTIGTRASSRTIASWYRYTDALGANGDVRNNSLRTNTPGDEAFAHSLLAFDRRVAVRDVSLREELGVKLSTAHFLDAGLEAHVLRTGWGWTIAGGDQNTNQANGSSARGGVGLPSALASGQDAPRAAGWIMDRYQVTPRVVVEPGVRIDWRDLAHETTLSPRVSTTVALAPTLRLRGAAGLYTQSPGYEKLLQSDYFVDLSAAPGLKSERAVHLVGAIERDFARGLTGRLEAYYKSFNDLIIGRLETPAETAARVALYDFPAGLASSVPAAPQITSTPVNGATGRAYGFDVYVAKRPSSSDRFSGWASYTWGKADRTAYGREYAFDYDRRHAVSAVGTYRLSRLLELAASARIAAGFPYTPAVGVRVASSPVTDASGQIVRYVPLQDANGLYVWSIDPGGADSLNTGRLPLFARIDLRVTFYPRWSGGRWQLYVEAINALNRKNAGMLDPSLEYDATSDRPRITYTPRESLPLLPSFGVRFRF